MAWGFHTHLDVRLSNDLANEGSGEWVLLAPLVYETKAGHVYSVPAWFSSDFASVPRVWGIYSAFGNRAHRPAVLHDWLCRAEIVPRKEADDLFLEAMQSIGMSPRHYNPMHLAVRSYSEHLEQKAIGD